MSASDHIIVPGSEASTYDAATRFFIGIPVWISISFLVDALGRGAEGMTGGSDQRMITTLPSHLILGYFVFSFLCATMTDTRKWRLRLGCFAHLFLVGSFASSVIPDLRHTPSSDVADSIAIVVLLYSLIFLPWVIVWAKFIFKGNVEQVGVK